MSEYNAMVLNRAAVTLRGQMVHESSALCGLFGGLSFSQSLTGGMYLARSPSWCAHESRG
jgi:hypothetical protein